MREPRMINATYRECSETVRRLIRPCFTCDFKHSSQCKHCPPKRVRDAILEIIRYGYKKMKEEGYVIQPNQIDEMDETNLIFERRY